MDYSIFVEIENNSYARLISTESHPKGSLVTTTIKRGQKKAIVKLFLKREYEKIFIKEYEVNIKNTNPAKEPRIIINGEYFQTGILELEIILDNVRYLSDSINLKKYFKKNILPIAIGTAAGALLLLFIFILLNMYFSPNKENKNQVSSSQKTNTSSTKNSVKSTQTNTSSKSNDNKNISTTSANTESSNTSSTTSSSNVKTSTSSSQDSTMTSSDSNSTSNPPKEIEKEVFKPDSDIKTVVYFSPNSPILENPAKAKLKTIVEDLNNYIDAEILIDGHCAPKGNILNRQELSETRAKNVQKFLKQNGWNEKNINITNAGYGGDLPVTQVEEEQYLNRRVEITIISK